MRDEVVPKTKPAWVRFKMHGFHHNPQCDSQKLGKDLHSQSYLSGYLYWYQIKVIHWPFIPLSNIQII